MARQDAIKHWRFLIFPSAFYKASVKTSKAILAKATAGHAGVGAVAEGASKESDPLTSIRPDPSFGQWSKHEELYINTGDKNVTLSRKAKFLQKLKNMALFKKFF